MIDTPSMLRLTCKAAALVRVLPTLVYYESIKRELNKRLIFDSRCDARLKDVKARAKEVNMRLFFLKKSITNSETPPLTRNGS